IAAWEQFGTALRADDSGAAAAAFVAIDSLLSELQGIRRGASAVLTTWHRECGEPFNRRHLGGGSFARVSDSCGQLSPIWLVRWEPARPGPEQPGPTGCGTPPGLRGIPALIAAWVESRFREDQYGHAEFRIPLDVVSFFGLLGTGRAHHEIEVELSALS